MEDFLPEKKGFLTITETAQILNVSADTIRRWDKQGVLHSYRLHGKKKYFQVEDIQKIKNEKPLSLSSAAKKIGISASTLRRLETKGLILSERNEKGERIFSNNSIKEYLRKKNEPTTQIKRISAVKEAVKPPETEVQKKEIEPVRSETEDFLRIRETAHALGMSIDTLRRWEKQGRIKAQRLDGKNRYFSRFDIERLIEKKPFTISEAAKKIGISASTLRRLEKTGLIVSERNVRGERSYTRQAIEQYLTSKKVGSQKDQKKTQEKTKDTKTAIRFLPLSPDISFLKNNKIIFPGLIIFILITSTFILLNIYKDIKKNKNISIVSEQISKRGKEKSIREVLAETTSKITGTIKFNIPAIFTEPLDIQKTIQVGGTSLFKDNITVADKNIDAGKGSVFASNLIYSITGGTGLSISAGQTPIASNTGVLSIQTATGALTLGSGLAISGLTLSNSDLGSSQNIFKNIKVGSDTISAGSNSDSLTFAAGTAISLSADTTNKKITITGSTSGSGWQDDGTVVRLVTSTDSVGIGTTSPAGQLDVGGGNLVVLSGGKVGIGTTSPLTTLDVSGNATISGNLTLYAASRSIQTTSNNTLTIGGSTTGNIILQPLNGSGRIGIGTTSPSYTLDISGGSGIVGQFSGRVIGGDAVNSSEFATLGQISGGAGQFWQRNSGTLAPTNISDDVLIGATSTSSAKFAFINVVGSGTPTASVSGNLLLDAAGSLQTTKVQNLTIGGSTTGQVILSGRNGASNGVTLSGYGAGLIHSNSSGVLTSSAVNLAGGSSEITGNLPVGNGGLGASISPAGAGEILYSTGTTAFSNLAAGSSSQCLTSGGAGAPSWRNCGLGDTTNWWTQASGAVYPINTTLDLLIGATSTASAKFAFINVNSGTPTASVSGNIVLDAAGTVQTTKNQNLTIGGNTTGRITLSPLNGTGFLSFNGDTFNDITGDGIAISSNALSVDLLSASDSAGTTSSRSGLELRPGAGGKNQLTMLQGCSHGQIPKWDEPNGIWACASDIGNSSSAVIQIQEGTGPLITGIDTLRFTATDFDVSNSSATGIISLDSTLARWDISSGTVKSGNATLDLLLGGTASSSAKFAVLNMNSGTPTASVSANSGNNASFLTGAGNLATTNVQNLTVGGSTTGQVILSGRNGANNGVTLSGYGTGLIHSGSTGILTSSAVDLASADVTGTLPIGSGGTNATATPTSGAVAYGTGSAYAFSAAGSSNQCLTSAGSGTPTWQNCALGATTNFWNQTSGALYPINSTVDLLVGGTATTSAKFAFINVNSGTPTASISGNLAIKVPTGSDASTTYDIFNGGSLYIRTSVGGDSAMSTRLFVSNAGNVGIGTASPLATLDVSGSASVSGNLNLYGAARTIQGTANNTLTLGGNTTGNITLSPLNGSGTLTFSNFTTNGGLLYTNASGVLSQSGAGSSTTLLHGGTTPSYSAVSLTADVTGTLPIGSGGTNATATPTSGAVAYGTGSAYAFSAAGSSNQCLTSAGTGTPTWQNCALGSTTNWWNQTSGALYPINSTVDLLIGGTATTSAKFAFINVNSGTPTASVSANSGNNATYLTGDGTLATTNKQNLTIGNSSTYNTSGNVLINPNGTGNVGIGTTTPLYTLDLSSTAARGENIAQSGAKTVADYAAYLANTSTSSTASINKYGMYVTSTGSWSGTAATNYGLYVDTTTGGTFNYAAGFNGDLFINKQTDSGGANSDWNVDNSAAGTFGAETTVGIIVTMSVYNGSLYVGSSAGNVYRYDGGTTWTRVTSAGQLVNISSMIVYNGYLYVGDNTNNNSARLYRYDGGTSWTTINTTAGRFDTTTSNDELDNMVVYDGNLYISVEEPNNAQVCRYLGGTGTSVFKCLNATAGRFGATTAIDNVSSMAVYNGKLYIGTNESNSAEVYVYNGGTGTSVFTALNGTVGTFGGGSTTTNIDGIYSMVEYNGSLYIGTNEGSSAEVYRYDGWANNTAGAWTVINTTAGKFNTTTAINTALTMTVYNGNLYVGTSLTNGAEVYRYDGGVGAAVFTAMSSSAGTIKSGGTSAIDSVVSSAVWNNKLYIGTEELSKAEVYDFSAIEGQSYALKFNAASDNANAEQNSNLNLASISFLGEQQSSDSQGMSATGTFLFSHGINTSSGAYDIAEDYPTRDNSLQPGELMSVDDHETGFVQRAIGSYNTQLVGVYSEKPGFRLSQKDQSIMGGRAIPVALAGRVSVKVSLEGGAIQKGDYLTSSSTPGIAMKASHPGQVVGKALEDFSCDSSSSLRAIPSLSRESAAISDQIASSSATPRNDITCQGKILVFVNVSYADPNNLLANIMIDSQGNLKAPYLQPTTNPLASLPLLTDSLTGIDISGSASASNSLLTQGTAATDSAHLKNDVLPTIERLTAQIANLITQVAVQEEKLASLSSQLSKMNNINNLSFIPLSSSQSATLTDTSSITPTPKTANSSDLQIMTETQAPVMLMGGLAKLDNEGSLVFLENAVFAKDVKVEGVLFAHTVSGTHGTLEVSGSARFDADIEARRATFEKIKFSDQKVDIVTDNEVNAGGAAGKVTLRAHQTEIKINNSKVTGDSLIFVTPKTSTDAKGLFIKEQVDGKSFTVGIDAALEKDIDFNFLIVN